MDETGREDQREGMQTSAVTLRMHFVRAYGGRDAWALRCLWHMYSVSSLLVFFLLLVRSPDENTR